MDPKAVSSELKDAKNVALVMLTANLPAGGFREGDKVNVNVSAVAAKSLKGGRLFLIPMTGPMPGSPVFAFAEGPITIEDAETPTVGVVRKGAQLTKDLFAQFVDENGRMTLVLNQSVATLPMANNLANLINDILSPDSPNIATAIDERNVVVDVPKSVRDNPVPFISSVLQTFVEPELINTGARVVINERTGTIVFSHDVQISPVGVTHKGMTIDMITPPLVPTAAQPISERKLVVGIDPEKRGGAKLADLVTAFNQMKVEAADRIAIIKEIHRSGKLHAKLIIEE
jgi:flagellar P-ring protein precursor FlgI